jgi:hypothetical protein
MNICNWLQVFAHSYCKVFLDFLLSSDIIDAIENYIWSAAACCRFYFSGLAVPGFASPKQPKTYPLESII